MAYTTAKLDKETWQVRASYCLKTINGLRSGSAA